MPEIAPGIVRKRPIGTRNRNLPFKVEKEIVKDYFLYGIETNELAKKYDQGRKAINQILSYYEGERLELDTPPDGEPPEAKEQVVMVNRDQIEFLMFLLNEWQIDYRVPADYEITERIQSKMNDY